MEPLLAIHLSGYPRYGAWSGRRRRIGGTPVPFTCGPPAVIYVGQMAQNAPCLIPPATPKLALGARTGARDPTPPVTNPRRVQPGGGEAGAGWQVISACAEERSRPRPQARTQERVDGDVSRPLLVCSLVMTRRWAIALSDWAHPRSDGLAFTDSAAMSELPLAVGPPSLQTAARAPGASRPEIVLPATVSEARPPTPRSGTRCFATVEA